MGATSRAEFGAFFDAHVERARRLAWRLSGGDEAAADDVVQEAFAKAYRGLTRFRHDAQLTTWFYRIVVNEAHNHQRKVNTRRKYTLQLQAEANREAIVADPHLQARITNALDQLSSLQRQVFVLVHLEGFTVRETADLLERAEGTIKTHLFRAVHALRAELSDVKPSKP